MKLENGNLQTEVKSLKEERDALLDIWSALESPVDWEVQKGRNPPRWSPQFLFPELAEKMKTRASTPAPRSMIRSQSRQLRRQTDRARGVAVDSLDRLRPKLLELSGKMELSEKLAALEELVREQSAMIEDLESCVEEERAERLKAESELKGNTEVSSVISPAAEPDVDRGSDYLTGMTITERSSTS